MTPITEMKQGMYLCSKCGHLKPISEFGIDKHKKSGHRSECKACRNHAGKQVTVSEYQERKAFRDTLRILPTVQGPVNERGVFVFVDTCDHCEHYSMHYGGCKIRDVADPNTVTQTASRLLSVPVGGKCKYWKSM